MERQPTGEVTPELVAEAAAWVAVLHGPNRTNEAEQGFAAWLKRSAGHARAFEEATEIWEEARRLPRAGVSRSMPQTVSYRRWMRASIVTAALAVVAVATIVYFRVSGISTGTGEQRVMVLADGTRVMLNTQTRVIIAYGRTERRVKLERGEALFEVANVANRPFIVQAGDREIKALGTSFTVRRESKSVAVTLVNGKVAIYTSESQYLPEPALQPQSSAPLRATDSRAITLTPGERIRLTEGTAPKVDRPVLDKLLAWERREVAFDDAALLDAISEMNRYSNTPLVAQIAQPESIRVTGLFGAGDSMSFARAVAEAYHLKAVERDGRFLLTEK